MGRQTTPAVSGCKRKIVRACFLAMINASARGMVSPVSVTGRSAHHSGTAFLVLDPLRVVKIVLESLKAFSVIGSEEKWDRYIQLMVDVASRRIQFAQVTKQEMVKWRSFQTLIRSAEICPEKIAAVDPDGRGKKMAK